MNPRAQTSGHVFLPLIARMQLVTCGLVLTAAAVAGGLGAIDADTLRALVGA